MNRQQTTYRQVIEKLGKLDTFPVKGSAVVGFFVEHAVISGKFYLALVEQSSSKQYSLRLFDNTIENFRDIKGENGNYKYFHLLGYVSMSNYKRCYDSSFNEVKQLPPIYEDPSQDLISAYHHQARAIAKIRKEYSAERARIPNEINDEMPITFVYVCCLDDPVIVKGAFTRMYDGYVYVNRNKNLEVTDYAGSYLYVPHKLILKIGDAFGGS